MDKDGAPSSTLRPMLHLVVSPRLPSGREPCLHPSLQPLLLLLYRADVRTSASRHVALLRSHTYCSSLQSFAARCSSVVPAARALPASFAPIFAPRLIQITITRPCARARAGRSPLAASPLALHYSLHTIGTVALAARRIYLAFGACGAPRARGREARRKKADSLGGWDYLVRVARLTCGRRAGWTESSVRH
jgi:hypothetical protein